MMADINPENRKTAKKEPNDSLKKEELKGDALEKKECSRKHLEIDIEVLISQQRQGHPLSFRCSIYQAHVLRDVNIAAFTPKIVSIGPLHHSQERLKRMEETKINYLKQFLQRAADPARLHEIQIANDFSRLGEFLNLLESSEVDIRRSYAENLNHFGREEFLTLVLVDAAFIIELFLQFHFNNGHVTSLPPYIFHIVRRDLWLLENQLPFLILEKLYDLAFGTYIDEIYPPFLELTFKFFEYYNDQDMKPNRKVKHFTDLLRAFFIGKFNDGEQNSNERKTVKFRKHLPSATQLRAAGVKFIATETTCLLDMKFSNGRLQIPSLHLWDETEDHFRNLIALEQNHYPNEAIISSYFTLMNFLLDTSRDADLLVRKKIVTHGLASNSEVARLFNSLCINITQGFINQSFSNIIEQLNKYHRQWWHRQKATLKEQYFSSPWIGASTIAAIILLALTLAQTILAVLSLPPAGRLM